jgi:GR25 family glycosyltransferase involved in LPS biosynthesis
MDKISKIVYINLERRQDRRQDIEQELATMELKGERFNAIYTDPGITGCNMSHTQVLRDADAANLENLLIFEDDFHFLVDKSTFYKQIEEFFALNIEWDIVLLSYNLFSSEPYNELIGRARDSQTTSGYLINKKCFKLLADCIEEATEKLINTGEHWNYALDQAWKVLQKTNDVFYFTTRIGKQREGQV